MTPADRILFLEQTIGEFRNELAKIDAGGMTSSAPRTPVGPGSRWEAAVLQDRRLALKRILTEVTEQLEKLKREAKEAG
jgi:hypothetical protein